MSDADSGKDGKSSQKSTIVSGARETNQMLKDESGIDLNDSSANPYKYGIPTTRAEFDYLYKQSEELGVDIKLALEARAKLHSSDDVMKERARLQAESLKQEFPVMLDALKSEGIDPMIYVRGVSKQHLTPSDIDISKLDPALTDAERKNVLESVALSRMATEGGMYVSTPLDAPSSSPWAKRMEANKLAVEAAGKTKG